MRRQDFDFALPEELIAHAPSPDRDSSRLMVLHQAPEHPVEHRVFHEISSLVKPGDVLIFNDTKVIPARTYAKKVTGGKVELLFLEPLADVEQGLSKGGVEVLQPGTPLLHSDASKMTQRQAKAHTRWAAMARSSRPLRVGTTLILEGAEGYTVEVEGKDGAVVQLRLSEALADVGLLSYLDQHGELPLPPYIEQEREEVEHKTRYQTVYAQSPGAVAAPTAGLHFTNALLDALSQQGVHLCWLTLHVGLGTFLPVKVDEITEHKMHTETYSIPEETAAAWRQAKLEGRRVIAVGTTSLRALESAIGEDGQLQAGPNQTDIFIYPGYQFRAIDGLLTNFHLPSSTLLMLVSALYGYERTMDAYKEAVAQSYRFFSYGDAMLILP